MKKLLITLLATASLAASPIVFSATHVVEIKGKEPVQGQSNVHSAVDVVILRFDAPLPELTKKIVEFVNSQASGARYSTIDAARFFSQSDQVFVEFNKSMGNAEGSSGIMENWRPTGVPVTSVTNNGNTKITALQSVRVTTGASAFVSVSSLDAANRATIALKIHQIVPTSGTDVSPYFGDTRSTIRSGEILPMFWTNNGTQYCAFLTLHTSEEKI